MVGSPHNAVFVVWDKFEFRHNHSNPLKPKPELEWPPADIV